MTIVAEGNILKLTRVLGMILVAAIFFAATSTGALGQGVLVSGTVMNSTGRAVPGVAVSLIHPNYGRSSAVFTDQLGQYTVRNVPPHPVPYFMEVYWGQRLIYRAQLSVRGPLMWQVKLQ